MPILDNVYYLEINWMIDWNLLSLWRNFFKDWVDISLIWNNRKAEYMSLIKNIFCFSILVYSVIIVWIIVVLHIYF